MSVFGILSRAYGSAILNAHVLCVLGLVRTVLLINKMFGENSQAPSTDLLATAVRGPELRIMDSREGNPAPRI